jgi:hypothetical protein
MSEYRGYYVKDTGVATVKMFSKQRPKLFYRIIMRLQKWYWIDMK